MVKREQFICCMIYLGFYKVPLLLLGSNGCNPIRPISFRQLRIGQEPEQACFAQIKVHISDSEQRSMLMSTVRRAPKNFDVVQNYNKGDQ